jgi:hypothetical protein
MKKEQYQPPDTARPTGGGGSEPFDSLFEHARRDGFTPSETERLWQNVVTAGTGGGDAGPEMSGGGMRGWGSGAALKATAVLAVAAGLLAAAFALKRPSPHEPIAVPSAPAPTATGVEAPRGTDGPPVVSWEDLPRAQRPTQSEAKPPAPKGRGAPPSPEPAVETGPAAPAAPPAAASSPSEGALLLRARQELVSDPGSALELTDEAGRRFPEGPLSPEREVLAIEALARLGRLPSARARFSAFRARYPQSPHLARLESLLTP